MTAGTCASGPNIMVAAIRAADEIGNLFRHGHLLRKRRTNDLLSNQGEIWTAIGERAFFHWKNEQAHGPDNLPEAAVELPSRYRGPCTVTDAA